MAMKRCSNGHFYDDIKYQQCPYCGISNMDSSRTAPIIKPAPPVMPDTSGTVGATVAMSADEAAQRYGSAGNDGKTVGIMKKEKGIDPVVGWLVVIEGPVKGKDYRIRAERNFIGRDASMDIAITGDASISRNNHASISYNPKNNTFKILPGDGHGLAYLNENEVYMPLDLKHGDIIEIGQTKLIFIPLCGEGFKW